MPRLQTCITLTQGCCADTLHRFCKKEHDWGWKKFMELNKVLEGFTVSNTLVIKAQVQVIRYGIFWGPCQDVSVKQIESARPGATSLGLCIHMKLFKQAEKA